MKIKTKLTLGVGLLFIMIILLSLINGAYINAVKNDTENVLVANYNTLEYARNMLLALDEISTPNSPATKKFEDYLKKQQKNITENGEKEIADKLANHYQQLIAQPSRNGLYPTLRHDIADIMQLSMEAIQRKNELAKKTALSATVWIALSSTICFLIAFTLLVNLPSSIAGPIKELSDRIKQIAASNYHQRVHFENHDEFGELSKSFNTMAKKLEEYHDSNLHQLLFDKKRIETLINNMRDPVIGLDEKHIILFANDEASKVIGLSTNDLIGKTAQDVAATNDLMKLLINGLTNPSKEAEKQISSPLKIYAGGKESFFQKELIEIDITPTGEKEPQHLGHVIILKNITPFKELDFAKTNFMATLSHELKMPISSIQHTTQLLEEQKTGSINAEQRKLIDSIQKSNDHLLKITNELLNLSQVETGNIPLNIQKNNPNDILEYALQAVKSQTDQKQILILTDTDYQLPDIKTDIEKTIWVLVNFLTNAIRYSPQQGKIFVQVKKGKDYVSFSVKDEGKGIDQQYLDKIFDKYLQIPNTNKAGIGLGLAISKEFIEAQDGQIGIESTIGVGSTFYFKLPI
ncbi:MAG: ATP-binding protein [Sphingobacteriaceae bacterium]